MDNQWYDIESNQWVDNLLYEWGFDTIGAATSIKQIFMDDTYVYAATTSGLSIIDIFSEQVINYISMYNGCTTVWSDNVDVFIGSSEGIDTFNKYTPSSVSSYISYPFINSKNVNHLHGNGSYLKMTSSGIQAVDGVILMAEDSSQWAVKVTSSGILYTEAYNG